MAKKSTDSRQKDVEAKPQLQVASIFETMIGMFDANSLPGWQEYNRDIIEACLKERIANPEGVYRSNSAGTWHSDDKQFEKPIFDRLKSVEGQLASLYFKTVWKAAPDDKFKLRFQSWIMSYSDGGYATIHTHPNSHLACVYFCHDSPQEELTMATGVKVRPGDLEFFDTRSNEQMMLKYMQQFPRFKRTPKAGTFMLFPAWLPHFVHPVKGEQERISIASNITILEHIRKEDQDGS